MTMKTIVTFCVVALAAGRAAANNYYVDPSGANGAFTSVGAALAAVPAGTAANRSNIFIKPGTYTEKLTVSRAFVSLVGTGADPKDVVLTYNLNATSDNGAGGTVGTTGSTSTTINATDFVAKNLTFANSTHDNVAQAVAIKTTRDRAAFENCRFWGFQDTLYVTAGRSYFKSCTVTGDTDFIFGNGTAVFDHSTINESSTFGYVTAANTNSTTANGLVLIDCTLTGTPNTDVNPLTGTRYSPINSVTNNQSFLGRPWQYSASQPASVTLINTKIGSFVKTDGWHPWDAGNTDPAATTRYAEFGSKDLNGNALSVAGRVAWSHQMTADQAAAYTLEHLFGPASFWNQQDPGGANPLNLQPHYTGPYTNEAWGSGNANVAWDPVAALRSVSVPEPGAGGMLLIGVLAWRRRTTKVLSTQWRQDAETQRELTQSRSGAKEGKELSV